MTDLPEFDDYAGDWVQASLNATERYKKGKFKAPQLTEFHKRCCAILSRSFRTGIYNLGIKWERAEFRGGSYPYMVVTIYAGGGWSTYDFDPLTRLVIAAHENCVRIDLNPAAPKYLRLMFHPRAREGGRGQRHITIEQAVAGYRDGTHP